MSSSASRFTPSWRAASTLPVDRAAANRRTAAARWTMASTPDRCTFTTTRSPVSSTAGGPADRRRRDRLEVERRELLLDSGPQLALDDRVTSSAGTGRADDCRRTSSVVSTSGRRSLRGWTRGSVRTHEHAAATLEREAQAASELGVANFDADAKYGEPSACAVPQ